MSGQDDGADLREQIEAAATTWVVTCPFALWDIALDEPAQQLADGWGREIADTVLTVIHEGMLREALAKILSDYEQKILDERDQAVADATAATNRAAELHTRMESAERLAELRRVRVAVYMQLLAGTRAERDVLIDEVATLQEDLAEFGEAQEAWLRFRRERDALKAAIERIGSVVADVQRCQEMAGPSERMRCGMCCNDHFEDLDAALPAPETPGDVDYATCAECGSEPTGTYPVAHKPACSHMTLAPHLWPSPITRTSGDAEGSDDA